MTMLRKTRMLISALMAVFVVLAAGRPARHIRAQDAGGATAVIVSPTDNEQLFGQIYIVGSAGHQTAFDSYTLEYNDLADPGAAWLLVQPRVRQQVSDGVLGAWNTNVVPDGVYRLRLRVFLQDGQVGAEYAVSGLRVVNTAPTPLPTSAAEADSLQVTPTPGPSPTSPIQQPPSNSPTTPEPFAAASDASTNQDTGSSAGSSPDQTTRINLDRITSAFCTGAYWAIGLFLAMLIYVALRRRLRPYTQRLLWHIQDELDDNQP